MKMTALEMREAVEKAIDWPSCDLRRPEVFGVHYVWLYHVIRASENLIRRASQRAEGDLKAYLQEHLLEEIGHEKWLCFDLEAIGIDAKSTVIPTSAMEMAGTQYYLVEHVSPVALLGYMLVFEGFPAQIELVDELAEVHGQEAVRTLRYHANHDVQHSADLFEMIDKITDEERDIVYQSAMQTLHYMRLHYQRLALI